MNVKVVSAVLVGGFALGFVTSRMTQTASDESKCYKGETTADKAALFELNGRKFAVKDLPMSAQQELLNASQSSYDQSQRAIEQTALRIAMAEEKKIDLKANPLPSFEELLKDEWVTEKEVKDFFETNKKSFPPTATFDQMAKSIQRHLELTKVQTLVTTRLNEMKKNGQFTSTLTRPCGPMLELDASNQPVIPAKSKTDSTLTIMSDYSCPQCRGMFFAVSPLLEKISENANVVHMAYSQDEAGLGFALAKGGVCTAKISPEKNIMWFRAAYVGAMKATNGKADVDTILKAAVADTALDEKTFSECFASPETAEQVRKNNLMAKANNIHDQMAIIMNKRLVVAATPDQILEISKLAR